jgi:hypothetical protein
VNASPPARRAAKHIPFATNACGDSRVDAEVWATDRAGRAPKCNQWPPQGASLLEDGPGAASLHEPPDLAPNASAAALASSDSDFAFGDKKKANALLM